MGDHHDLGLALWARSGGASSSVTNKALVERDLLGLMEETNYQNSGVDVALSLRVTDPSPGIKKCMFCSDTSTPLWRNGPDGPKTLCNACGIRHRKEVNKIVTDLTLGPTPPPQRASGGGGKVARKKK